MILTAWLLFGVWAAVVASQRGSGGCLWLGIGILLGPIGVVLAYTQGVTCEYCGKKMSSKASICPYCHASRHGGETHRNGEVVSGGIVLKEDLGMTKQCPFCAEEIKAEAIKCKHCGSMLSA